MAEPLIARAALIFKRSSKSTNRQKPTRFPYSCQAQLGMSGLGEPPAGGGNTVRGMGSRGFHSSTLTMTHTARRAPWGSVRRGRAVMGEYAMRSFGSTEDLRIWFTIPYEIRDAGCLCFARRGGACARREE